MGSNGTSLAPPVHVSGQCSVIYKDVLYVYSPSAFQALSLKTSEWQQLSAGQSVTGGVCVLADDGDASLYIVGGSSSNSSYTGLQRYLFSSKQWETITPATTVTKNRLHHGAAYVPASQSIVVYGGSQDGDNIPSSQTFTISAVAPYGVDAYSSGTVPMTDPLVVGWTESKVLIFGGSDDNVGLFTFQPKAGWADLGTHLGAGLPAAAVAKPMIVNSADGSRYILLFDASVQPNKIRRYQILGAGGVIMDPEDVARDRNLEVTSTSTKLASRTTTVDKWSTYDSSDAPKAVDSGFSLAVNDDGMAVIMDDDSSNTISLFNQKSNSWVDPADYFQQSTVQSTLTTSGAESASSASSSAAAVTSTGSVDAGSAANGSAADSTIAGSSSGGSKTNAAAIAGGVFGALAGLAMIGMVYWWYRRRQDRNLWEFGGQQTGPDDSEKGRAVHSSGASSISVVATASPSIRVHPAGQQQQTGPQRDGSAGSHHGGSGMERHDSAGSIKPMDGVNITRGRFSDGSMTSLVNAGASPGLLTPMGGYETTALPQITVSSTPSSVSTSPLDRTGIAEDGHNISLGEVPSGTVGSSVVESAGLGAFPDGQDSRFSFVEEPQQRGSGWSRYFDNSAVTQTGGAGNMSHSHMDTQLSVGGNMTLPYHPGSNLSTEFTLVQRDNGNQAVDLSPVDHWLRPPPSTVDPTLVRPNQDKHLTTFDEMTMMGPPPAAAAPPLPFHLSAKVPNSALNRPASSVYAQSTVGPPDMDETYGTGFGFGGSFGKTSQTARSSQVSTMTVFPGVATGHELVPSLPGLKTKQDMSWFTLGTQHANVA